ncbi:MULTISPECIES: carbohydrate kinase family protein [unclassified Luteococcus]|uniref:carbohydrate kinase family protein n=1 Tax=unclassified Luteococcus TaxID=2639923 RepID=UPI00313C7C2F
MKSVFLGLTTLDVVQRVGERPPWGVKSVVESTELTAGGPAANAAVTAAALLGRATLITGLGSSPAAHTARADLEAHGVTIIDLADPSFTLPVSTCVVEPDGTRTVFSTSALRTRFQLNDAAHRALATADALLVDGHHPVAAGMALGLLADSPCLTVLDAGSVKPAAESWLSWLDVVAGSADYAQGLGVDLAGAVRHVLERGATAAVMTDGGGKILWRNPSEQGMVQPPSVSAVDTLGAGDAFHGALVAHLLLSDGDLAAAVAAASRVASLRVQHAGARGWLNHLS